MPGVTFNDQDIDQDPNFRSSSGDNDDGSDDDDDAKVSNDFKDRFGTSVRPGLPRTFSYKVVGRLSRWEGGRVNPYKDKDEPSEAIVDENQAEKLSIGEFLRQFLRPTYDFTEVTIEDIERVKIMHDRFLNDSQFNFNYTTLLIIASVIAGVGLGQGSSASIIASMLVSPLMGPVTAIAYGISIGDYKMVRMGLVTEVTSLIICVVIGVIIASIMVVLPIAEDWPQSEMLGRGTLQNFFCGIPIAFFSGLGVAVGLLDSQTNSLVGVAISASLLPPAVNAGMLWMLKYYHHEGIISLSLTVMNIAVIIIASMFMFRLKETLPIEKSIFWSDLGVARKIYHNVAIFPVIHEAPCPEEIKRRVTRFFPRASAMKMDSSWNKRSRNLDVRISSNGFGDDDQNSSMLARISE